MSEKDNQNRQYQDSVFVRLFTYYIKKLLSVCKVLDPSITSEDIELIKLENTLYTGIKNDISCKVENRLIFLIEHQSTVNENMPLRCLQYIGRIFEKILEMRDRYARLLIKIPTPEFYVFYTGNENLPAIQELKLSDAFIQETETPQLELVVKVINLNSKGNDKLLKECPILKEYTDFVRIVKEYRAKYGKEGYDKAIRYCIKHGILKDFIVENAKEIESMLVAEYDYDLDMQVQREESYNAGVAQGITQGMAQGISQGISQGETRGFLTTASRMKKANFAIPVIQEMTGLSKKEIEKL